MKRIRLFFMEVNMKKVGIVTINGNNNFGNKLQNYALLKTVEKMGFNVETIWFVSDKKIFFRNMIKKFFPLKRTYRRFKKFLKFTDDYLSVKYYFNSNIGEYYDYFVVGSDQVWNYNFKNYYSKNVFLPFSEKRKNISYAASIGVENISNDYIDEFRAGLKNFKAISVREDRAKELVENLDDGLNAVVLVDPTMLLDVNEWDCLVKKPKKLGSNKFILNYFLGKLSKEKREEIERIAKENDCVIVNILDINSPFYECGPREFLYLEKNAFLVCTDSFHSSVFAFLFDRPFIVFERDDKEEKMSSRINTLLSKFHLDDRRFCEKITDECLKHDYTEAYKILEDEKEKSYTFLKKSLIDGDEENV